MTLPPISAMRDVPAPRPPGAKAPAPAPRSRPKPHGSTNPVSAKTSSPHEAARRPPPPPLAEEEECPLCCTALDATDRRFKPCACGYQLCAWCWHQLMEQANAADKVGRCPACRAEYDERSIRFDAPSEEDLAAESRRLAGREHVGETKPSLGASEHASGEARRAGAPGGRSALDGRAPARIPRKTRARLERKRVETRRL